MADSKITALTAISTVDPAADPLVIVDVSDTSMAASGTTKKGTINQFLGAGGTATLASATITGDLTVDTSTLKVDSANNRVGIGTASPSYDLEIAGAVRSSLAIRGNFAGGTDIAHLRFINANGSVVGDIFSQNTNGGASDSAYLSFNTASSGTSSERYRIAADGIATWSNVGGVAGTATLASATITGDLTVRTNKLAVTSTGVGVGTTSVLADLNIQNGSNCRCEFASQAGGTVIENLNNARNAYLNMTMYADAYIWNRLGTTAMTLNSTGLGVGGSPATKIFANVTPPGAGQDGMRVSDGTRLIQMSISGSTYSYQGIGANQNVIYASGNPLSILSDAQNLRLGTSSTSYLLLDTSGNVGIGVTPSAWGIYKGLQVGYASLAGYAGSDTLLGSNVYFDGGAFKYIAAGLASSYRQLAGGHQWSTAVAGANPGDPLTLLPQMTLDASGNLILQSSATPATLTTNGQLTVNATSNTNLRFSYRGSDGVTRVANITLA